jgi:hypothetical protein
MKTTFSLLLTIIGLSLIAQAPAIEWQKSLGGSDLDHAVDVKQTLDGGCILVGATRSEDGDITSNNGNSDVWVVKLNSLGEILWQKTYGGSQSEEAFSIILTNDGGYAFAGYARSNDGDVTLNKGQRDFWIVKLNDTGDIIWQKTYGGTASDLAYSIKQTSDQGFVVVGQTTSNNGDVTNNNGWDDIWVIKLNEFGGLEWQKSYGGNGFDMAYSVQQTFEGGYIVAGETDSNDTFNNNIYGHNDFWILKLNTLGELEWQKNLGGSGHDSSKGIIQTTDGGYVIVGYSRSNDFDVTNNNGNYDFWVVKINEIGNIIWQKSYGGSSQDRANSIFQANDGGFVIAGESESNNGYLNQNFGQKDVWVIKLNGNGDLVWQKSFGGSNEDYAIRIIQTNDNGYTFVGGTFSNDINVSNNNGQLDVWIVKLFPDNLSNIEFLSTSNISIYPNPTQNFVNISSENNIQKIELYDVNGRILYVSEQKRDKISLENFSNGIYFLKIQLDNGDIVSQKIQKSNSGY